MNVEESTRKFKMSICVCAALAIGACQPDRGQSVDVSYVTAPALEGLHLPFPAAVRADQTLYLSGVIGNIPGKLELIPGGIAAETRQTMENMKATLETVNLTMDDIVKCTVFMADISEWGAMNAVYRGYFTNPPARSALGTNGLALGARVEIDCIAVFGRQ